MRRRALLSALASIPMAGARAFDAGFRRRIEQAMAVGPVPGLVVGRVEKGATAWIEAMGHCRAGGGPAVIGDTVFQAASLSKQVTAYAAFALRDQGKLDFARPLVSYVDDIGDARSRRATIRHVLSHSAGFPNWRFEAGKELTADFEPGERWQYSGEGYVYLQRIIEKVTGKSFFAVVEELVFQSLGMRSSAMAWMPQWEERYAQPHRRRGEPIANWDQAGKALHAYAKKLGREVSALRYEDSVALRKEAGLDSLPNSIIPNAAASMVTTANDYARFVAAATKNPEPRTELVTMRSGKNWMIGWGLGWGIERVAGREYLWQWGDNGGFKNIVFAEPAKGSAVFVFTNGDAGAKVYERVVTHVTGHDHPALLWI
ncbi:MAG: serine hydrolase domain-containing protein [Bryobacteraceae bacterium]